MDIGAVGATYASMARAADAVSRFEGADGQDDAGLKKACLEFEAYFLNAMFKEMRKTSGFGEKKSMAERTFQEMADDATARKSAESGGIGLAAFLYKQMKREQAELLDPNA